jgi:hypothetical protein
MQDATWGQAFSELTTSVVDAFVRFWKQDIVQVGLGVLLFLAIAVPLLLLIAVLWYIDSTGWRPQSGFYKIGLADTASDVSLACALWLGRPLAGGAFTSRRRPGRR